MKKTAKLVILTVILVFFDQWTKGLAVKYLMGTAGLPIIDGVFRLQYLENRGAAFGMLQNQQVFFALMTVIVLVILSFLYFKMPSSKRFLPLEYNTILLISGAIGNFIDRTTQKYVVDFLYFELIDFPIFNVADCYVVIATFLFALLIVFYYKEEELSFLTLKKKEQAD